MLETEKIPVGNKEVPPQGAGKSEREMAIRNMYKNGVDIVVSGTVRRVYSIEEQIKALQEGREN